MLAQAYIFTFTTLMIIIQDNVQTSSVILKQKPNCNFTMSIGNQTFTTEQPAKCGDTNSKSSSSKYAGKIRLK